MSRPVTPAVMPSVKLAPFSGSYRPEDCEFLLKPLSLAPTPVAEKERLIQSGVRHYSEMLPEERPPAPDYLAMFRALTATYAPRVGQDLISLAADIATTRPSPLTIVSLARAGTPIGALLARALRQRGQADVRHYSVSIIRDRGIDENALLYLLRVAGRPPAGLVFVDGWTAKGVITRELHRAIAHFNRVHAARLDPRLYVLSDLGGSADVAAGFDDYAIPSGLLNAPVSGLVSRSVLNEQIGPSDFHGCVYYADLAAIDHSGWFLDRVSETFAHLQPRPIETAQRADRARCTDRWVADCMAAHGLTDINLIKPGVAEATRVFLRRLPARLILRDPASADVQHLLALASTRGVPVEIDPKLAFAAAALIRSLRPAAADLPTDGPPPGAAPKDAG